MNPDPKRPRPIGTDGTVFKCPMCKAILPDSAAPSFPFCSDRCRLLDLNNWLDERYGVSRPLDPTDQLDEPLAGPAAGGPDRPKSDG